MNNPSNPAGEGSARPLGLLAIVSYWLTPASALLIATLLVEGLWFYLWMVWMGLWGGLDLGEIPLTPVSILILLWTSYHTVQILGQQRWSNKKAHIVAGCFVVLLLVFVVRLENGGGYGLFDLGWMRFAAQALADSFPSAILVTFLGGAYLWWRGYRLASGGLHQEQVLHSFTVGLGGIILGLLVWEVAFRSGVGFTATRGQSLLITIAFFAAGLPALALSHLMRVRADMAQLEGPAPLLNSHWSLVLLGVIVGMLVAGGIVAVLFSFNLWGALLWLLSMVSNVLAFLVYYLLFPVAYLVVGLIYAIQWLISLRGPVPQPDFRVPDLSALRAAPDSGEAAGVPVWVVLVKWGILLLFLSLVVYFLARLLLRVRGRSASEQALVEIHESLGTWKDFLRDVLQGLFLMLFWFRDRGLRLRRRVRIAAHPRSVEPDHEMGVRELYGRLLQEARAAGFPRRDGETPSEYLATLERHLADERDAVEHITQDYVAVRYGEQALSHEENGLLNKLWSNVYAGIRRVVGPDK